jgi:hypothetical protein
MDFRASYGEKITGNSWVMHDLWQTTTNTNYGARWGLATSPKNSKVVVSNDYWNVQYGNKKSANPIVSSSKALPILSACSLSEV